jgi:hypothetical protein
VKIACGLGKHPAVNTAMEKAFTYMEKIIMTVMVGKTEF